MSLRLKVMIPLFFALLILMVGFIWTNSRIRTNQVKDSLTETAFTLEKLIASELSADVAIMKTAIYSVSRDEDSMKMLKAGDRESLLKQNANIFERLRQRNKISHFYFHRLNKTTLLRLHEVDHFDDKIGRITLQQAEATGNTSYGIEQGPTGASVLRVVSPVFYEGQRIGYLELGKEFQDIVAKIEEIIGLQAMLLVEKKWVERERWEKRNNKLNFEVQWDFLEDFVFMASGLQSIPEILKDIKIDTQNERAYTYQESLISEESVFDFIIVPIENLSKQRAAYILLLHDSTTIRADAKALFLSTAGFSVLVVISLLIFFYVFLGRVQTLMFEQEHSLVSNSRLASLGEMAGGVAHEINTPLSVIQLRVEQLIECAENNEFEPEQYLLGLTAIKTTTQRIASIIRGLKDFSRDGSNDPQSEVMASELIENAFGLCREKFYINGVTLEAEIETDCPILCRPIEVSQALINLLSNAFDAQKKSSDKWVKVEVKEFDKHIEISVKDGGPGVPKEIQSKIMQPFFTTKDFGEGTGLGLSISKGLIESHGGKLFIDPKSTHTKFTIRLPKATPQSRAA